MSRDSSSSPRATSSASIGLTGAAAAVALAALFTGVATLTGQDKPRDETDVCADDTCHPGIVDRKVMHGPTARRECLECHAYADPAEHRFEFITEKQELCWECHDLDFDEFVHAPVDEGDCTGCHDPHGSDQPVMLVKAPSRGLCLTCHDPGFSEKAYVHGPVAAGSCLACHQAHTSSHEKLLSSTPTGLCLDCHSEMAPAEPAPRHQHQPAEEDCTKCHDSHAADAKFQLHTAVPGLCFSCHDGVKDLLESAPVNHGPVGEDGGCVECHNPHFTELPWLQKLPEPDSCLKCHNEPVETSDGRTLTDIAALLMDNPNHHGPIREGECTACHEPHAGEHFRLLYEQYPAQFYAPFDVELYALCFDCHEEELVEGESGTGLTGFRHGDRNLHWLHVNQEKGRTCRACHEVHASKRPFHIREAVPFGEWMLKINFEQTSDGGTCSPGCHKTATYSRSEGQL